MSIVVFTGQVSSPREPDIVRQLVDVGFTWDTASWGSRTQAIRDASPGISMIQLAFAFETQAWRAIRRPDPIPMQSDLALSFKVLNRESIASPADSGNVLGMQFDTSFSFKLNTRAAFTEEAYATRVLFTAMDCGFEFALKNDIADPDRGAVGLEGATWEAELGLEIVLRPLRLKEVFPDTDRPVEVPLSDAFIFYISPDVDVTEPVYNEVFMTTTYMDVDILRFAGVRVIGVFPEVDMEESPAPSVFLTSMQLDLDSVVIPTPNIRFTLPDMDYHPRPVTNLRGYFASRKPGDKFADRIIRVFEDQWVFLHGKNIAGSHIECFLLREEDRVVYDNGFQDLDDKCKVFFPGSSVHRPGVYWLGEGFYGEPRLFNEDIQLKHNPWTSWANSANMFAIRGAAKYRRTGGSAAYDVLAYEKDVTKTDPVLVDDLGNPIPIPDYDVVRVNVPYLLQTLPERFRNYIVVKMENNVTGDYDVFIFQVGTAEECLPKLLRIPPPPPMPGMSPDLFNEHDTFPMPMNPAPPPGTLFGRAQRPFGQLDEWYCNYLLPDGVKILRFTLKAGWFDMYYNYIDPDPENLATPGLRWRLNDGPWTRSEIYINPIVNWDPINNITTISDGPAPGTASHPTYGQGLKGYEVNEETIVAIRLTEEALKYDQQGINTIFLEATDEMGNQAYTTMVLARPGNDRDIAEDVIAGMPLLDIRALTVRPSFKPHPSEIPVVRIERALDPAPDIWSDLRVAEIPKATSRRTVTKLAMRDPMVGVEVDIDGIPTLFPDSTISMTRSIRHARSYNPCFLQIYNMGPGGNSMANKPSMVIYPDASLPSADIANIFYRPIIQLYLSEYDLNSGRILSSMDEVITEVDRYIWRVKMTEPLGPGNKYQIIVIGTDYGRMKKILDMGLHLENVAAIETAAVKIDIESKGTMFTLYREEDFVL